MDDDLFSQEYSSNRRNRSGGDNLFAWTVFMLLLIGFALGCWITSYYLFGHPEHPRSYRILMKLKKLEPPKRFELTAAPPGEFLSPQKLFDRYATYTRLQLEKENAELMRNYISNYQGTKRLVPYVIGRFSILDSYALEEGTIFPSGVVALAQAKDYPQVLLEHAYTSPPKIVPGLKKMLSTGLDIKLERTMDLSAIIHIAKLRDGRLQFTAVPLTYGGYELKQGSGAFSLEPPVTLNLEAGVPILKGEKSQEAFATWAKFRNRNAPANILTESSSQPNPSPTPSKPELVRAPTPPPEVAPLLPVAKAIPVATPAVPAPNAASASSSGSLALNTAQQAAKPLLSGSAELPKASPSPSVPPAQVAVAKPTPKVSPEPSASPSATPAIVKTSPTPPPGVQLQPFLAAAPTPNPAASSGGSWKVYPPGQMPRGRLLEPQDMNGLAERGTSGERLYLRGQFVVTASGEGRAVLRSQKGISKLIKPGSGSARVIVEFPSGITPPSEGSTFSRDEQRPFQITDVRRGADGQINVYVREVTAQ